MILVRMQRMSCGIALVFCLALSASAAGPVGSAFTYQGILKNNGSPLPDGSTVDLQFSLWDAAIPPENQIGSTQTVLGQTINGGLVSVPLDFGAAAFAGQERWLQIAVRSPAGGGSYTTLSPRQPVRPSPYAIFSLSTGLVPNSSLSGTYSGALNFSNAANTFTGAHNGSGSGLISLNASNISTGTLGSTLLGGTYTNAITLNNASNVLAGSGAGLTNLNASNIASGNLNIAQMPTGGNWTLSSILNLDSNTLVIDPVNNRVAIGGPTVANRTLAVTATGASENAIHAMNTAASGTGNGSGVVGITSQASASAAGVWAQNTNFTGTALIAASNGVGAVTLPTGSGGALIGNVTGAFVRSTTGGVGQGLYAQQFSDVVRVAYFDGATFFKINGIGSVSTIVRDTSNRPVTMYCAESPEILLTDYGQGELIDGYAHIDLDPILAHNMIIDARHPLRVFIQLEDNEHCQGVVVKNKTAVGFDVVELRGGRSNTPFQYQVTGNRADEVLAGGRISHNADSRFKHASDPEPVIHQQAAPDR